MLFSPFSSSPHFLHASVCYVLFVGIKTAPCSEIQEGKTPWVVQILDIQPQPLLPPPSDPGATPIALAEHDPPPMWTFASIHDIDVYFYQYFWVAKSIQMDIDIKQEKAAYSKQHQQPQLYSACGHHVENKSGHLCTIVFPLKFLLHAAALQWQASQRPINAEELLPVDTSRPNCHVSFHENRWHFITNITGSETTLSRCVFTLRPRPVIFTSPSSTLTLSAVKRASSVALACSFLVTPVTPQGSLTWAPPAVQSSDPVL